MDGVLLIRFSIEKLNELPGPYTFQKGFLVGKAVPAPLLGGMTILEGDTWETLQGLEYATVLAVRGDRERLREEIEPRIVSDEDISRRKDDPFTQIVANVKAPLYKVGVVQNGELKESGWCSKGFRRAWDQT